MRFSVLSSMLRQFYLVEVLFQGCSAFIAVTSTSSAAFRLRHQSHLSSCHRSAAPRCSRLRLAIRSDHDAGKGRELETAEDAGIDLDKAMSNARMNMVEGRSPGAGLESAFDQADAAFADLIVTSVDDQGVSLGEQEIEELAKSGMMESKDTKRKSKGLFGDVADVFTALSGGAHIVKREDGSL